MKGGVKYPMYLYKKKDTIKIVDFIDTEDEFEIEERIIKLIEEDRSCKGIYDINTKFNGVYTSYTAGTLPYQILSSKYLLNEDGSIKSTNPNEPITLPVKRMRKKHKNTKNKNNDNE